MSVSVNGVAVATEAWPSAELAAVHELLRQRAVATGVLATDAGAEDAEAAIERLLEQEVSVPAPTDDECRRYYDGHPTEFRSGELAFVRHILFQVTPGVAVNHVRAKAERTLMDVLAEPDTFAAQAQELSNCPSGVFGGNLGQMGRGEAVPEFESAIFEDGSIGILPSLVKTRYGFHIVAVDHRLPGKAVPYEAVREQIAERLTAAVQQRALTQYVTLLAGEAEIAGADLARATSPLVQ
ncbi:MAG: peptidylprolyl isomerase [Trebonia sp.]